MIKKIWNWIKTHKGIVILLILVLFIGSCVACTSKTVSNLMSETKLETRDIITYNSFVGTVETASSYNVMPKASSTVTSVQVKEGDEVVQGQTIATLDSSTVEYSIKLQEATLGQSGTSSYYSIKDAEESYENYKETLEEGLNASLISSSHAKDNAWNAWNNAKKAYDEGVASINSSISSAESALSTAASARTTAKTAYETALSATGKTLAELTADYLAKQTAMNEAEAALTARQTEEEIARLNHELDPTDETKRKKYEDAVAATKQAQIDYDAAELEYQTIKAVYDPVMSAKTAYDSAESAYSTAETTLSNLKSSKDSTIETLRKTVADTEHELEIANLNYASTELSVNQQLETLQGNLDRIKATSSNATGQLELSHLRDSLKDYTITAPVSGTITSLNIKEGDLVTSTAPAAVISNTGAMKISIKVDEYSILNTQAGKPVIIYIDSIGSTYDGVINSVAETATTASGVSYFDAEVGFTPDEKVRSGMSVEVRLVSTNAPSAKVLPVDAISYHDDNSAYVLVKTKSGSEERSVTIGVSDGDYVQIVEGLSEEDTVLYFPTNSASGNEMRFDDE